MFFDEFKIDKNYGADMNVSLICDENGKFSIGCHYTDSNGCDISHESTGDDYEKVLTDTYNALLDGVLNSKENLEDHDEVEQLRKRISELEDENYSLKLDNDILLDRLKEDGYHKTCDKLCQELFDSIGKIDWKKYL